MLRLNNNSLNSEFKLFLWFLMSFQAGYINVGGFIIFGNFVSHVTGTSSQIGMGVASLNAEQLITFFGILLAFIAGAAIPGHFLGRKLAEGKEPHYITVSLIKVIIFALVLVLSEFYLLTSEIQYKLELVLMLSLACGIQNAACSIATNGFLKPTHMTGLSTDIGINLTRIFGLDRDSEEYKKERKNLFLRIGILFYFILGGGISYFIFSQNGHYGFIFPFLSSLCLLATSILSERKKNEKFKPRLKLAQTSVLGVFLSTILVGIISIFI